MFTRHSFLPASLVLALFAASVSAAPRDVKIRSVNFETGILELHNFGAADEPLLDFRFAAGERRAGTGTGAGNGNDYGIVTRCRSVPCAERP